MRRFGVLATAVSLALLVQMDALLAADGPIDPVGRPKKFAQGKGKSYGVWYEDGVWKLRTTSSDQKVDNGRPARVVFHGRVTCDGDRMSGDFSALEKAAKAGDADFVRLSDAGKTLDFKFATFGGTDGVDFKVGPKAKTVTFKLEMNKDDDPRWIRIGAAGRHPPKAEFTFPANPSE